MKRKTNRVMQAVCAVGLLISGLKLAEALAARLIAAGSGGFSFSVRQAASIGIIGGADGPTAIFVTATPAPVWQILLWLCLLAGAILGLVYLRRQNRQDGDDPR